MAVAGWLVERVGKVRIMSIYLCLMVLMTIPMAFTRSYWMVSGYVVGLAIGYQTLYTFFMVAYLATSMNLCWRRVSATQFTLYMAIGNMGRAVGSSLLGPLRERLDWSGMFLAFATIMFITLIVAQIFRLRDHQRSLDRLETEHAAKQLTDFGGAHVPR